MVRTIKKLGLAVIGAMLAVIMLSGVSVAAAQDDPPPTRPDPANPGYSFRQMGRWGMMGGGTGWMAAYQETMHAAVADALGMTVEEFNAARAQGQTMWQLAEAQGVELETVWQTMNTVRAQIMERAVADGVLTAEQAEWMQSRQTMARGRMGSGAGCDGSGVPVGPALRGQMGRWGGR